MNKKVAVIGIVILIMLGMSLLTGVRAQATISSNNFQIKSPVAAESGGGNQTSTNFWNRIITGIISGLLTSPTYQNLLGFFYGGQTQDAFPIINFTNPTPTNNTVYNRTQDVIINISSSDDEGEHSIITDWNRSLVGWWKFNNQTTAGENTTLIKDWSTYSNNGTSYNGAHYNESGKRGGSWTFDGVDDRIIVGNPPSLNFESGAFSFGLWYYPQSEVGLYDMPLYKGGSSAGNKGFDMELGSASWSAFVANGTSLKGVTLSSDGPIGQWVHLFVVIDRDANKLRGYYNGNNVGSGTDITGLGNVSGNANLVFSGSGSNYYLNGSIDDVMIFNRALNQTEIKAIYNATQTQYVNNFSRSENLVPHNYTYVAYAQDTRGQVTATENRIIQIIDNTKPVLTVNQPANDTRTNQTTIVYDVTSNEAMNYCGLSINHTTNLTMTLTSNKLQANYTLSSIGEGIHNWTITCNDTYGNYNNTGIRIMTIDTTYPTINFTNPTPNNASTIGETWVIVNVTTNDNLGEHSTFVDWDNSLVGWWTFNNGSLNDMTGRNNATNYGSTYTEAGARGGGRELNGTYLYSNFAPNFGVTDPFTLSVWARTTQTQGGHAKIVADYASVNIQWNTNNKISFLVRNATPSYQTVTAPSASSFWNWHHIIGVYNGSQITLYLEGVNQGTLYVGSIYAGWTFNEIYFGRDLADWTGYFNGTIDDVMIFDRALNSTEIGALYNASQTKYVNNFTGLGVGSYSYKAYVQDLGGNINSTETRTISTGNTPPNITQWGIMPDYGGTAYKSTNLNCTFNITDLESSNELSVNWSFWKNNASNLANGTATGLVNGANNTIQLMKANITKGETWKCMIIPIDGITNGTTRNSSEILIQNTQPTINLLLLNPGNISSNRYPNFTWVYTDADNETESYTYTYNRSCYPGCSADNKLVSGLVGMNYSTMSYLRYLSDENYYYNWSVRANDGETEGSWSEIRKFTIQGLVSISLDNASINFGGMQNNEHANTTTGTSNPFVIINDGNVFTNITLNASDLWARASNPTDKFQYKITNNTGEEGAFYWGGSNTTWTNMPSRSITGMAIAYLNWSDTKDSARMDIRVTSPIDEGAGNKSSTIIFEASYADERGK